MNNILNNFGFKISNITPKKKEKQTSYVLYFFEKDGTHLCTDFCKKGNEQSVIKEHFNKMPSLEIVNIKMLNGKTKIIKRETI